MSDEYLGLFEWLDPQDCKPPHAVGDLEKYKRLKKAFEESGWDNSCEVSVGYPDEGKIQLLSSSHRWVAAMEAGVKMPVLIRRSEDMWNAWGNLEEWQKLNKACSVAFASEVFNVQK